MRITIASSTEEQAQAFQVRVHVFVEEQKVSMEEEMDEHEEDSIHFIGYINDKPVAASRLRWINEVGKLERICILKDYRGKSYGTKMIQAMEQELIQKGFVCAKLHAQTQALAFYKRLGYQVVSEEFLDAGIPHVAMTKQLHTSS